jgi:hypothetical protein
MAALVKSAASPKMFRRNYKRRLRQQHGQTSMSGKSALCKFVHGAAKVGFRPLGWLLHLCLRFKIDQFGKCA